MHLTHLSLADFRSYAALELPLEPGVAVLVGPNGQGKTNVVEAIGYLANQASHRVAQDAALVRAGAQRAVVRGAIRHEDRSALVELEINPGRANRARLGRAPVTRPRDVLGYLRTVLFAPEDLALVKGDPAERRKFLDELLVARAPRLAAVRADYDRALKQRNALLRSAGPMRRGGPRRPSRAEPAADPDQSGQGSENRGMGTLDVWDAHLARAGAQLLAARLNLLRGLAPLADKAYGAIAGRAGADLAYRPSFDLGGSGAMWPESEAADGAPDEASAAESALGEAMSPAALAESFAAALAASRPAELERGMTLVGPHRDDVALSIDHGAGRMPAKTHASHGESWSFALALKLASFELLRSDGIEPVLLLDDVFAELDSSRRGHLAAVAARAEQVVITAAVEQDVPAELGGARFTVGDGRVERKA
ncbi:MAG TPA: DNA replication/repair protein RecF [Actinocrinis sp.]